MEWTRQMEETAERLWIDGRSASQIALTINNGAPACAVISRNAVIGKLSRMGVKRGPSPQRQFIKRSAAPPSPISPAPLPPIEHRALRVEIHELTDYACAFPLGDPRADDFRYCGAIKPSRHHPYCAHHKALTSEPAKRAITPPQTQRGFNGSR